MFAAANTSSKFGLICPLLKSLRLLILNSSSFEIQSYRNDLSLSELLLSGWGRSRVVLLPCLSLIVITHAQIDVRRHVRYELFFGRQLIIRGLIKRALLTAFIRVGSSFLSRLVGEPFLTVRLYLFRLRLGLLTFNHLRHLRGEVSARLVRVDHADLGIFLQYLLTRHRLVFVRVLCLHILVVDLLSSFQV